MGNRVEKKHVKGDTITITRYLRDASGNVMGVYNDTTMIEQPIYGSSRLGQYLGGAEDGKSVLGLRRYELSNHLTNVLSVISDKIFMHEDTVKAFVLSTHDYYPFGLEMDGRTWNDTTRNYRYGFNGKEKDPGSQWGNTTYDYGFRVYNPAIGKFLSVDPLTGEYPMLTSYQFASNSPIASVDLDGKEGEWFLASEMEKLFLGTNRIEKVHIGALKRAGESVNGIVHGLGAGVQVSNYIYKNLPKTTALNGDFSQTTYLLETLTVMANNMATSIIADYSDLIKRASEGDEEAVGALAFEVLMLASDIGEFKNLAALRNASKNIKSLKIKSPCGCFAASTLVLTVDGYKKIEDIKVGDMVAAYDVENGLETFKKVLRLVNYERDTLFQIEVGPEIINTTSDHPFFIDGKWKKAKDIMVGDKVHRFRESDLAIRRVAIMTGSFRVFNFTVEEHHNYFVSNEGVLVHNGGPCDLAKRIRNGETRLTAASRSEAAEVLREMYIGGDPGTRNADSFNSTSAKDYFNNESYYHWDEKWIYNEEYGGYHLENHNPFQDKDAFQPHLQIHDKKTGEIIRIFYPADAPTITPGK